MKIFCYDLMLVELLTQRGGISFLFQDSSIDDGVDSRQRSLALIYADRKAKETKFQYICAKNSDMIPNEDFIIDDYVRLILKDQKTKDSTLGFHFELSKKNTNEDSQ